MGCVVKNRDSIVTGYEIMIVDTPLLFKDSLLSEVLKYSNIQKLIH